MVKHSARNAAAFTRSIIGEHGFSAILGTADGTEGIIGTPRIDPTSSGLWIQDSYAAAIDAIVISLLEDFVKRSSLDARLTSSGRSGPPGRTQGANVTARCATSLIQSEERDLLTA